MRPPPCAWWALTLVIGLAAPAAQAELLRFKNGETLQGRVVKRTADEVVIELDYGTVSFAPGDLLGIEADLIASPDAAGAAPEPAPAASVPSPHAPAADTRPAPMAEEMTLPRAVKAVVFIAAKRADGGIGVGSGVVINATGTILTNNHVVAQAEQIGVLLLGDRRAAPGGSPKPYEARLLRSDPCLDLALISIPRRTPDYLALAATDAVEVGEPVQAIGNPQGLAVSVSKGIVSAVRTLRELTLGQGIGQVAVPGCEGRSNRALESVTWIQTDAAINPGNSGGPLLNHALEVVGINTMILSQSGGSEGLGFALHVKDVRRFAGSYAKPRARP